MDKKKAWRTPVYAQNNDSMESNPAGNSFHELQNTELESYVGAGTANTNCNCYSDDGSCGRFCTGSSECPIMTIICC